MHFETILNQTSFIDWSIQRNIEAVLPVNGDAIPQAATHTTKRKLMPGTLSTRLSKSDELLQVLRSYDRVLVVMHDNPDPDAIASGWGVQVLIEEKLGTCRCAWWWRCNCAGRESPHGRLA